MNTGTNKTLPHCLLAAQRVSGALVIALMITTVTSTTGFAQDAGVVQLDGIVIEGGSLSGEPTDASKVGASVSVVTREDLERRQVRNAGDALRTVPGVAVSRTGGFGSLTQVRLRGAEGNHTLVLIDGVEVNDTNNGEFDFSDLLVDSIERIEVIRGPQSGIYGSNALGGVINIITRSGKGPAQVTAKIEGGSFATRHFAGSARGGNETIWGGVSLGFRETDGFNISEIGTEDDEARHLNVFASGGVEPLPGLTLTGFVKHLNKQSNFDNLEAATVPGFQVPTDSNNPIDKVSTLVSGSAQLDLFDEMWINKVTVSQLRVDDRSESPTFRTENESVRKKATYTSTLKLNGPANTRHAVTGLAEWKDEQFTPTSSFVTSNGERGREFFSFAGEYRGEFFENLFLKAAVRHDDVDSDGISGTNAFGGVFFAPETQQDFTTYTISGAYKFAPTDSRLHASVGTGVVFPTLFEMFGVLPDFFEGNPDLRPEESFGWDVGVEQTFLGGKLVIDVTYFKQDLQNEIVQITNPATFNSTVINLNGESERQGIEVSARMQPLPWMDIVAAYTYLDAEDPDGFEEVRRAPHSGSVDVTTRFLNDRARVNLGLVINGNMKDTAFFQTGAFGGVNRRVDVGAYVLGTLAAEYDVTDDFTVFGRVENLFDEDYQEVFGFNTPDIAAYAGLKVRFGE